MESSCKTAGWIHLHIVARRLTCHKLNSVTLITCIKSANTAFAEFFIAHTKSAMRKQITLQDESQKRKSGTFPNRITSKIL